MVFVGMMTTNLHSFKPRSDIFEMIEFPLLYFSLLYMSPFGENPTGSFYRAKKGAWF